MKSLKDIENISLEEVKRLANTLPKGDFAFEKALQAGADMIETDVHLTKE